MTPTIRALLMLPLTLLLLPACSGGSDAKPAAIKSSERVTEPREYARALADAGGSMRESYTSWAESCSTGDAVGCGVGAVGLSATAETLAITLQLVSTKGRTQYLGPLAERDQGLLDDTITDADDMRKAAKALMDAGCNTVIKLTPECVAMGGDVDEAWRKLDFDLAGWAKHA